MQKIQNDIQIHPNIIKLMSDKSNDKRKIGIKELDQFLKVNINFNSENLENSIISSIKAFKSLSDVNQTQQVRRVAFLGYTTIANLIKQNGSLIEERISMNTIKLIIQNILFCFKDNDSKVVYSAAESLYNIMKYFSDFVILFFNDIFEGLLLINVNPDFEVRTIAQNLDSSLKEIINYSLIDSSESNLRELFQKIYEKISAKHPAVKVMIVSWIVFINSIPEIKIINVIQEFLSPLFNMLSEKQKEVNSSADKCLKDLLKEIENFFECLSYETEVKILEILIDQFKSKNEITILTAFEWIFVFLSKYKYFLLQNKKIRSPFTKSIAVNKNSSQYNKSHGIIPSISSQLDQLFELKINDDNSNNWNSSMCEFDRKIPYNLFPKILDIIISFTNHQNSDIKKIASECNYELITIIEFYMDTQNTNIKLFEEVLKTYFNTEEKESTVELVLIWINKLFKKFHEDMFTKINDFVENLSSVLSHSNENLFNSVLEIICEIAKYKEEYVEIILSIVLDKMCNDKNMLNHKGLIILKKFSTILNVDRVYSTFADVLLNMKESEFVERMINILNLFLITGKETEPLRNLLKNFKKNNNPDDKQFFEKIFKTWSRNPVSCLVLCLLAEFYELSNFLLIKFGELDLNKENYVELAQLVQLLESDVFMHIRINLLEPRKNIFLVKSLFGILLMLPQGKAYQALYKRLKHIEVIYKLDTVGKIKNNKISEFNSEEVEHYINIFESIQKSKIDINNIKTI